MRLKLAGHWSGYSAGCAREFGGIVSYRFFHVPVVMISDPDAIETVLVRNAATFTSRGTTRQFVRFSATGC